jgi:dTDP-4-amino-4,6-dideoxygalactose transaminase
VRRVPFQRPRPPSVSAIAGYYARSEREGWYTRGPCVGELGRRVAALSRNAAHGIPTSSGTVGLMVALRALAASRPDADLVVLPSFTCAAMASAVVWSGLRPLFVDVDPAGWHVDPGALRSALEERPGRVAAVLTSATFGTPPPPEQRQAWQDISDHHGVPLVFDAAAGIGTADALGAVTAYSFEATKPGGVGEGGALVTSDADLAGRLRILINYGLEGGVVREAFGLNGKLSELGAAAVLATLDELPETLRERRARGAGLRDRLAGLDVAFQRGWEESPWSAGCVAMPSASARAAALQAAAELDVEVRTLWDPPLHRHPVWAHQPAEHGDLTITEQLATRMLALPMATDLDPGELDRAAEVVHRALAPPSAALGT